MKVTVRRGVFETNSSSEHAVVIDKSGDHDEPYPFHHTVEIGDYGRRTKLLAEPEDRLSYVWTAVWTLSEIMGYGHMTDEQIEDLRTPWQRREAGDGRDCCDLDFWRERLNWVWTSEFDRRNADGDLPEWRRPEDLDFDGLPWFMKSSYETDVDAILERQDRSVRFLYRTSERFREYFRSYWSRDIGELDHAPAIIPLIRHLAEDDDDLRDFIFGRASLVLVSNDEGGSSRAIPLLASRDEIEAARRTRDQWWNSHERVEDPPEDAPQDEWDAYNARCQEASERWLERDPWREVHDFPESRLKVFMKGE